jgi:hypothetical protein
MEATMSTAISGRMPPVLVEYDCRGQRVTKYFANPYKARSFYVAKDKAGKQPKVKKVPDDYPVSSSP